MNQILILMSKMNTLIKTFQAKAIMNTKIIVNNHYFRKLRIASNSILCRGTWGKDQGPPQVMLAQVNTSKEQYLDQKWCKVKVRWISEKDKMEEHQGIFKFNINPKNLRWDKIKTAGNNPNLDLFKDHRSCKEQIQLKTSAKGLRTKSQEAHQLNQNASSRTLSST